MCSSDLSDNEKEKKELFERLQVEDTPEEKAEKDKLRTQIESEMRNEPLHVETPSVESHEIQRKLVDETIRNADIIISEVDILLDKHRKP